MDTLTEEVFLREFSSKIILINHPPIWDEFWIFECIMGQSKKKRKKCDSRVKTQKDSLEQKWEDSKDSWTEQTEEREGNDRTAPEAFMRSSTPFKTEKSEPSFLRVPSPNFWVYHGRSYRLSNCHIQKLEKMNLFKDAWFSKNLFFEKKDLNVPPLCSTQLWK